jgi:hypothetical protein
MVYYTKLYMADHSYMFFSHILNHILVSHSEFHPQDLITKNRHPPSLWDALGRLGTFWDACTGALESDT